MSRLTLLFILVTLLSLTFTFASESRRGENGNRIVLEEDEDFFARQSMMTAENYVKVQLDSVAPLPYAIGQNNYTYAHSSGVRLFYLYVPTSYGLQPTKNVSLVLVLHGLTDHAINFAHGLSNMTAKAEEMGFIILYPQGSTGYRGTGWNAGTCCIGQTGVDDVGFISQLIQLVQSNFLIRPESIHSMGFSNGGFMSERLACQVGGLRSIASVSGGTILYPGLDSGLKLCDESYAALGPPSVSVLRVHGDADNVVLFQGDPNPPNSFPPVIEGVEAWRNRNGCGTNSHQTFTRGNFSNQIWDGCFGELQTVELVLNHGGGHIYPQNPNRGFVTTNYILQFMDKSTPGGL